MKKGILLIFTLILGLTSQAQEKDLKWETDYLLSKELANRSNKNMLYFFTFEKNGDAESEINKNLFSQNQFKRLSKELVLLKVDYSSNNQPDAKQQAYNKRLVLHHNKSLVFPSILVLDSKGKVLLPLQTDFSKAAVVQFIDALKSL